MMNVASLKDFKNTICLHEEMEQELWILAVAVVCDDLCNTLDI